MNRTVAILLVVLSVLSLMLCYTYSEVSKLQYRVDVLTYNVSVLRHDIYLIKLTMKNETVLSTELMRSKSEIRELKREISNLNSEINTYRRYGTIRSSVPLSEVLSFLANDRTNLIPYRDPSFVCIDYSHLLIYHALQHGIFMCEVSLWINTSKGIGGHSIVEVNTTDHGIVYIEPQTDQIIPGYLLHVGKNYCSLTGWDCKWIIVKISSCFRREVLNST